MKKIIFAAALLFALPSFAQRKPSTPTEQKMEQLGLVRLQSVDPTIRVELMFASENNFTNRKIYTDIHNAYLHPQAAQALRKAQAALKRLRPELSLMVLDAARPLQAQALLYQAVVGKLTNIYVSDPRNGGDQHNYGLAVDVTLCDEQGDTLEMGTRMGDFVPESGLGAEEKGAEGPLSAEAIENRQLLRRVMAAGGFKPLRTEWWHFNIRTRSEAKANFRIIK